MLTDDKYACAMLKKFKSERTMLLFSFLVPFLSRDYIKLLLLCNCKKIIVIQVTITKRRKEGTKKMKLMLPRGLTNKPLGTEPKSVNRFGVVKFWKSHIEQKLNHNQMECI